MLGAIAGDIIGSPYERVPIKRSDFPLFSLGSHFTDDSVLTVATAYTLLYDGDYRVNYQRFYDFYPDAGYGGTFVEWARTKSYAAYNSWGNGSAMRVSPVAYAVGTLEMVLEEAKRSAEVTHDHSEGIKGAQAIAAAIFLARTGEDKATIQEYIASTFQYDLQEPLDSVRDWYHFDVSCQGTVPQAIRAFLESEGWEDAVRKAVSLGGDSDTLACIAGSIAEAYYGEVPAPILEGVVARLDPLLLDIVQEFQERFPVRGGLS